MTGRRTFTGVAAISVTAVLWGTTGTAATFAPDAGPLAIGAAALGIGGLLQAAIAFSALRSAWTALRAQRHRVILGALAVTVYPLAFYTSMALAGVAIGSVVSLASAPLASGLLERIVERRPLSRWWMLSASFGIGGSVLLCFSTMDEPHASASATVIGVLLGLIAGGTYATFSWIVSRLMTAGISRAASMGAVFGVGGALLMPVLAITGAQLATWPEGILVGAYMALIPMFLGYLLFGFGLTRVFASTATTITLAEPAVAALLAVHIVGERLTPLGWIGLGAIAVGLLIVVVAPVSSARVAGRPRVENPLGRV